MRLMTREAKRIPDIRQLAGALTNDLPSRGARRQEITRCFEFVRESVTYKADVTDVETLTVPQQTLKQGYGDCDDMAMTLAALLEAIGFQTRFSAYAFCKDPTTGKPLYGHVLTEVAHGYRTGDVPNWLSLDPTVPYEMGWRPPAIATLHILRIFNGGDRYGRDTL